MSSTNTPTSTPAASPAPSSRGWVRPTIAFIIDLLLVVIFAVAGRMSHELEITAADIIRISIPFGVAVILANMVTLFWKSWDRVWPHGVIVWLVTVVVGVALRSWVFGDGSHWSFVVVTAIAFAVFLLGRRLISALITRNKNRRAS